MAADGGEFRIVCVILAHNRDLQKNMTILDEIIAHRRMEIGAMGRKAAAKAYERSEYFGRVCLPFAASIANAAKSGIIAEFKRQSPSKGVINGTVKPEVVTVGYEAAGASALSILTNTKYFGGTAEDILVSRPLVGIPILRKEFVVDELQILEAKAIGADAVLLIAEALSKAEVRQLAAFARSLGLEVLMEVNSIAETSKICPELNAVGVNNRNLHDFSVDIARSMEILPFIPDEFVKVSESGLSKPDAVIRLRECGYAGFLMGETFMKESDPGAACRAFAQEAGLIQ